jgi:ParB-like chromosome segregation protein Spo0J
LNASEHWPADRVERRQVAQLIPAARNARTHSEEHVAQIAASIKEFGWTVPVLCDEGGALIAGHGRVLAAQKLGLVDIPVITARGWSEAQRRAYAIADNKLPLNAEWDLDLLKLELGELKDGDFDLSLIGFSDDELNALLADGAGLTDPDEAPEPTTAPVSELGDAVAAGAS